MVEANLIDSDSAVLVQSIAQALLSRRAMLATAESCTGGLLAAACTDLAGSSQWFERGFVTYSNAAKTEELGVDAALIAAHGAVSEQVALAMAQGAARAAGVAYGVSTTGVAGPDGGSAEKPVGTVCFGFYLDGRLHHETQLFCVTSGAVFGLISGSGEPALSRAEIRQRSVAHALTRLNEFLQGQDCHV